MARSQLRLLRNGKPLNLDNVGATETVLDYLRLREGAKGTKEGCREGDCGACTVSVGSIRDGNLTYEPVNSCVCLMGMLDGKDLITIEDLSLNDDLLHPVQQALVDHHGSQCGFCTPGIVMSLFTLYEEASSPGIQKINQSLAGNLCRCTGYQPIVNAAMEATANKPQDTSSKQRIRIQNQLASIDENEDLFIGSQDNFFAAPASLASLASLYLSHPQATLVSGATDVGLWVTKLFKDLPKIIHIGRVMELGKIISTSEELTIGAGVTYANAAQALTSIDPDLGELIERIGSPQVRSLGTIGGNIANGSPIGDMPPALIAVGATVTLQKGQDVRTLPLEEFFIAYGKQDRAKSEFLTQIQVPKPKAGQHFRCYKISKRFDQDISALLAAFFLTIENGRIKSARVAFGGMAEIPKRASTCEAALVGVDPANEAAYQQVLECLQADFQPISDMRASASYRLETAKNLTLKALAEISGTNCTLTRIRAIRPETIHEQA